MQDYDIATGVYGSDYYSSVIYYTNTQAQLFGFGTETWWE